MKKDYFVSKMFMRLFVPSMVSSVGFAFADMADALVVGNNVGETGLAAIALCLPVYMLLNFIIDSFGIGGSVRFSQLLGEGKKKEAVDCFNRIWTTVLIFGVFLGITANIFIEPILNVLGTVSSDEVFMPCLKYVRIIMLGSPILMLNIVLSSFLRNDNNPELVSKGLIVGSITDISMNVVLVTVFKLGTSGAAIATVLGSVVAICFYLYGILFKGRNLLCIKKFKINFRETFFCFKTGFSTSASHLFKIVFFLVINRLLMDLSGENGVAVFDVVFNASLLVIYVFNGTGEAEQPLISTFCGENSMSDCKFIRNLALKFGLIIGAVLTAVLMIFAGSVTRVFGISEETVPMAEYAFRVYFSGLIFAGINIILERYYQAMEDAVSAFVVEVLRSFVALIPIILIFARFGEKAIWFSFPLVELITLALFAVYRIIARKKEPKIDENRILRKMIKNDKEDVADLLSESEEFCEKWNVDPSKQYFVTLIVEEICMFIIRNALKNYEKGKIRITLCAKENGDFILNILDNAVEFNPLSNAEKKEDLLNDFDIDDISMTLIRKKAKSMMYRQNQGFNSLYIKI